MVASSMRGRRHHKLLPQSVVLRRDKRGNERPLGARVGEVQDANRHMQEPNLRFAIRQPQH